LGFLTITHVGIIPEDIENEEKEIITCILNELIFTHDKNSKENNTQYSSKQITLQNDIFFI
jgi:hypothetical protein